jgi:histidyl-tRNA synthetase
MADALLGRLGVRGTETLVNSVGCRVCRPAYSRDLRSRAERVRKKLCPDCQRKIETNPLRIFDCKVEGCRAEARDFPKIAAYLCEECRDHFARFRGYLDLAGVVYRVEPNLVRGLDYYTKTIFEIAAGGGGQQNAVLGGGRYDDMMKDFGGPDICGTGFAMGVERLVALVDLKPEPPRFLYVVHVGEAAKKKAVELALFFRRAGVETLLEFTERGFRSQFARANKLGAAWVLIIGEDEVARGTFQLKDMASGTQTAGTANDLLAIIKERGT